MPTQLEELHAKWDKLKLEKLERKVDELTNELLDAKMELRALKRKIRRGL